MFQRGIAPENALDEKSNITDPSGTLAGTFPVSKLSDKSTTDKLTESFRKSTERAPEKILLPILSWKRELFTKLGTLPVKKLEPRSNSDKEAETDKEAGMTPTS